MDIVKNGATFTVYCDNLTPQEADLLEDVLLIGVDLWNRDHDKDVQATGLGYVWDVDDGEEE